MKVDSSLLLVVFLLFTVAVALTDGLRQANVIQQVIKALEHRDDMKQVVKHLEKTEKDLVAELPLIGSSMKTFKSSFLYSLLNLTTHF
jgi:hypothetical protein